MYYPLQDYQDISQLHPYLKILYLKFYRKKGKEKEIKRRRRRKKKKLR